MEYYILNRIMGSAKQTRRKRSSIPSRINCRIDSEYKPTPTVDQHDKKTAEMPLSENIEQTCSMEMSTPCLHQVSVKEAETGTANVLSVKEEPRTSLYTDHVIEEPQASLDTDYVVKDETVVSPELPFGPNVNLAVHNYGHLNGPVANISWDHTYAKVDYTPADHGKTQFRVEVKVEEISAEDAVGEAELGWHNHPDKNGPVPQEHGDRHQTLSDTPPAPLRENHKELLLTECSVLLERYDPTHHQRTKRKEKSQQKTNTYICDYCGNTVRRKAHLIRHINMHLQNTETSLNKSSNYVKTRAKRHGHTRDKSYHCEVCKKEFSHLDKLKAHKCLILVNLYDCKICRKEFTRIENFRKHQRIHTGDRPYAWDVCKQKFIHSTDLYVHKRVIRFVDTYACKICQRNFSRFDNLQRHKRVHTGDKPYDCEVCKKKFSERQNLVTHKRIHTGHKPYDCNLCKRQFTDLSNFRKHKRLHTGEKLYSCDICSKTFVYLTTLKTHKRIHTRISIPLRNM